MSHRECYLMYNKSRMQALYDVTNNWLIHSSEIQEIFLGMGYAQAQMHTNHSSSDCRLDGEKIGTSFVKLFKGDNA